MPRITIESNSTLDKAYANIMKSIDQGFRNYNLSIKGSPLTEAEAGEIETMTNYAQHAGDLYDAHGVHLERRLG